MARYNPVDFLAILAPQAIAARKEGSPLFPSVRLAQNILETGWNIDEHHNLGGFKVGDGKPNEWWRGDAYATSTWEVVGGQRVETVATWRSYDSVYAFYRDQDRLLQSARYARVRAAIAPEDQARALHECGYATDPLYGSKLINLIVAYRLKAYDIPERDEPMTAEEKQAFDALARRVGELEARALQAEAQLAAATQPVAAPGWFVKEFGSADLGGLILNPLKKADFWETVAVSLRMQGLGSGSNGS